MSFKRTTKVTRVKSRSFKLSKMSRRVEKSRLKQEAKRALVAEEMEEGQEKGGPLSLIPPASKHSLPPTDILRIFTDSFKYLLESPNLEQFVQAVKGDLYNRDYIAAFGNDDKRMAYCARWTPSRALSYTSLFSSLKEVRESITDGNAHVLSIGGGAGAELIALSAIFTESRDFLNRPEHRKTIEIDLIDIADWTSIVIKLTSEVKNNWVYSDPECLKVNFKNDDVLKMTPEALNLNNTNLITLLFTTNELFAENKAGAMRFLQSLKNCQSGCHLLITESAGSYSHITVGTKKFPIQFLTDTILLGKDGTSGDWELINQSDSCWYRCGSGLQYPLKLENMRFFFRLYRKK